MNVYCAGIYDDRLRKISVGIITVLPDGTKRISHHQIDTDTSWDETTGTKAAQYEAVLWGLQDVQDLYLKFKSQLPFGRMHFVDFGGGSQVLDLRGVTEITIICDRIVRLSRTFSSPNKLYKNWKNQSLQIEEYFRNCGIQIIKRHGDVREARVVAEENRPESKYYKYSKNILNSINDGEYAVSISIFRKHANLTISETLVLELIDCVGLSISKVAKELGRDYNTIQTQYTRAKKKIQAKLDQPVTSEDIREEMG